MDSISPVRLCAQINKRLPELSFRYENGNEIQTLELANRASIRFMQSAGGGVAGGSAAWVRQRHQDGNIHEPGLIAALLAISDLSSEVKTIFDIGALYGYVSLIGGAIFQNAEVHAFEVNPNSFRALQRNFAENAESLGAVLTAHHCALSDLSEKQAYLRVRAFTVETAAQLEDEESRAQLSQIDVWSLDDFCDSQAFLPDLIKIDVEGYQSKIIPGAKEIISRARPIVLLEFDGKNCDNAFGVSNKDVIRPLIDMGYRLIWGRHRAKRTTFRPIEWESLSDRHEINSLGILVP